LSSIGPNLIRLHGSLLAGRPKISIGEKTAAASVVASR
jgi:hypothetical protein